MNNRKNPEENAIFETESGNDKDINEIGKELAKPFGGKASEVRVNARVRLNCGDNRTVLDNIGADTVDHIITDPPYGIGKAGWDTYYPKDWLHYALPTLKEDGKIILVTNAGEALRESINLLGPLYKTTFAAWLCNGMTRGPISFGNWIPITIGSRTQKWEQIQDVIRVTIKPGEKVKHESQKPLELMRKVVKRLTEPGDVVLDPFMGSGTTGVACVMEDREFIGIDEKQDYVNLSQSRIE